MKVLVTGGLGYIGSHTVVELYRAGHEAVIVDDLSNSDKSVLTALERITKKTIPFYEVNILNEAELRRVFEETKPEAVIHFAAFKSVPASVAQPLDYYTNNVYGTVCLCRVMQACGVKNIVFSSSATVYGTSEKVPFTEDAPLGTTNPYGTSKLVIEGLLRDVWVSDNDWSVVLLRYFNPVGAHESGLIGENPRGIPGNLMPRLIKTALGEFDKLTVCGTDYPTPDGTGVRDYIHVCDLADGHIKALQNIDEKHGVRVYNLGTGKGYSVWDLIHTFEDVNGVTIPYSIEPRRPGDIAVSLADPTKAETELGWKATRDLGKMCSSAWSYAKKVLDPTTPKKDLSAADTARLDVLCEDRDVEPKRDSAYAPVSAVKIFFAVLLFLLPAIGLVASLIFACAAKNKNIKHLALAFFILHLLVCAASVALMFLPGFDLAGLIDRIIKTFPTL